MEGRDMKYFSGGLKALRTLLVIGLLTASLALNVSMFVGGALYAAASSAVEAITGMRTVASRHAAEVADLATDLDAERRAKRELQGEIADLSDNLANERRVTHELRGEVADLTDNLVSERAVARRLTSEAAEVSDELLVARRQLDGAAPGLVTFRGRKVFVSEAVVETADAISNRARKSAAREMGSMAGEALPYLGTAVIVGVTAMELKELCDTIRDMNELKRAFNPELDPEEGATTVCSMEVPTSEELWESAKGSPLAAWEAATGAVERLPSIDDLEVPDLDWSGYWDSVGEGFSTAYQASASGVARAYEGVSRWGTDTWTYFAGGGTEPTAQVPQAARNATPRGGR
jgi:hypothetical protein